VWLSCFAGWSVLETKLEGRGSMHAEDESDEGEDEVGSFVVSNAPYLEVWRWKGPACDCLRRYVRQRSSDDPASSERRPSSH
jgi:hypothetical protein